MFARYPARLHVVGLSRCRYVCSSVLLLVLTLVIAGCRADPESYDDEAYPYTLQLTGTYGAFQEVVDLDGDGRDELISHVSAESSPRGGGAFVIRSGDGKTIDQVNFADPILNLHFVDLERDGLKEIVVPHVRNDSLFVTFVNGHARKLGQLFLASGSPRETEEGLIPWDPFLKFVDVEDVDGDRSPELVSVIRTGLAQHPRGVFVHSLRSGELLGKTIVGASLGRVLINDFDGDGRMEIAAGSGASFNGAEAGGLDDRSSYAAVFDLSPNPTLRWFRRTAGLWSATKVFDGDFDGDGRQELLVVANRSNGSPQRHPLQILDPLTGETIRSLYPPAEVRVAAVIDLDGDGSHEIIAADNEGYVTAYDGELQVVRRRKLPSMASRVNTLGNVGDDGGPEVAISTPQRLYVMNADLEVRATVKSSLHLADSFRRGVGTASEIHLSNSRESATYRVQPNTLYLLHRHGRTAAVSLVMLLTVGGAFVLTRKRRRRRAREVINEHILEDDARGHILLDERGALHPLNRTAAEILGSQNTDRMYTVDEVPSLAELREKLRQNGGEHASDELTIGARLLHARINQIQKTRGNRTNWLVTLSDSGGATAASKRSWALMAQRVAHDLKNPLTTILLTQQRLQLEYQDRAPEIAAALDPYTERTIDRVEHLRRMTNNFMKFVGAEEPRFSDTDLSKLICTLADSIREDLPDDIGFQVDAQPDVPGTSIDADQIRSAIENLVSNAQNAMPEGGRITISTHLARALQFAADEEPTDFVVIEVKDTGIGMSASVRRKVFEPGFTRFEHGAGLGLALVNKIVEDHGGRIEVESQEGVGTAISLYFPAQKRTHAVE